MSFLDKALELAARGFHIFPLMPNSKLPLIKDFPNQATTNPDKIRAWWIDPVMEFEKDYNIGISTSKFGENEALVVVDVDNKEGKKGDDVIFELTLEGKELPKTFTQHTPTKGLHYVYRTSTAVKQGTNVLGKGVDIRSKGGYIVGAGSVLNGSYYTEWPIEIATSPKWLLDDCGRAPEKSEIIDAEFTVDTAAAMNRAQHYLSFEAPLALEGDSGDQTTFMVAARVKDLGLNQNDCYYAMANFWNDRCSPPWDLDELISKINNAYKYGNEPVGVSAPEAQFTPVIAETEHAEAHYLHTINMSYALILIEGSHSILHETVTEKGSRKIDFLNEATFKRIFSPQTVQKNRTYAQVWLDWENRRTYAGLCFAPEREARNGYYNLWGGFTVAPLAYDEGTEGQRKGFDMFISHARENVCQGDELLFLWLMGYFAHMVQRPYERPLTTLVFRGGKGVGKNTLIDRIGKLLGDTHYLVAQDGRYLTSNFNGHMDSCLCLVLDEAFWSGDKAAEGKLKGLTTSPTIMIERKGKETYTVDNLVRLVIIGNDDWLVPASNDERRYAVYDVGEGRKQDRKFFHEMRVLMDEEGGCRILLDYLKNFDLSLVDVNDAPKTQALLEQKVNSLDPFEEWWLGCLTEGRLSYSDFGEGWESNLSKERFRGAFYRFCKERNIRSRLPDDRQLGKMLRKVLPNTLATKVKEEEGYKNSYKIPDLAGCREAWEKHIGQEVQWE